MTLNRLFDHYQHIDVVGGEFFDAKTMVAAKQLAVQARPR